MPPRVRPLALSVLLLAAVLGGAVDVEVSPTGTVYGRHHERPQEGVPVALDRKLQKLALLELYAATDGPRWADSVRWTEGGDPCQWYGVRCASGAGSDVDGTLVTHLQLPANKLNGTIPDVFGDLPHLRVLDLSLNYLKGPVPETVGRLAYLEKLDLGYNYLLLSLKSLAGLRTLESLCLRWNTLVTGSLEDIAGSLTRLRDLDLRDNKMTSLTTAGLADMTSLRTVHLERSGLHGALDLAAIRHLDTFLASGNRLEGVLRVGGDGERERNDGEDGPSSHDMFRRLVTLDLADNMLEGRIPRLPQASGLAALTIQNNNFEGSDFRLRDHPRLEHVDMSGNALLQPFPVDFFRASKLVKFLCANCGLTGVLALPNKGISPNPDLEELVLFNNELLGVLPDALWNLPSLRVLDLSNNQFYGAISSSIGRLENLEQLELASNRLSGTLPGTMGHLSKLQTVRLEHNAFSGTLPEGLFDGMLSLQVFAVHGNALNGIPGTFPAHVQAWPLGLRAPATMVTGAQKDPAIVVLYGNRLGARADDADAVADISVDVADDDAKVYRVCGTMNDFFHNTLVSAGWLRTEGAFFHASYGKCYGDSDDASARSLLSMQRASRFPYVGQLSDKGLLTHNIEAMRKLFPEDYSFYPRSFTIPAQLEEYKRSFAEVASTLQNPERDNLWLMKPRARCCGEGIRIINKAEDAAALVDPNLGEWYTQRFVSPPALIDGHKFVFRLFAVVTSFSPLRVQLFHDGLIFYTFTPYTVVNQTAKRSYISDYFFTDKQTDYFLFTQDYIDSLRKMSGHSSSPGISTPASVAGGEHAADKLWGDIKAVVVKSLVAGASWTARMQRERTHPGTVYEIFGYDIVLDDELNPFLCEINETPNMGLEVNYHSDYNGKGATMERDDYNYKTRLMDATLSVANVEPRYSASDRVGIREDVLETIKGGDYACFAGNGKGGAGECLSAADLSTLVDLEAELRRGEASEYDQVFPCVDCARYFDIMRHTNLDWGDVLGVWWMQLRNGASTDVNVTEPKKLADFLGKHLPHSLEENGSGSGV